MLRSSLTALRHFTHQPCLLRPTRSIVRSILPDISPPDVNYFTELHAGAAAFSDQTALIDGQSGTKWTFSQLRATSLSVASGLFRQCSLQRGDVLTVFTNNCPEYVFAMHGTVAAGGAASPINPTYTSTELKYALVDAGTRLLVTDRQRLPVVKKALKGVETVTDIFLIGETDAAARQEGCRSFDELLGDDGALMGNKAVEVDANQDLAYLPYSSGTTGKPKGVMLTHNNVGSNLRQSELLMANTPGAEVAIGVLPFFHIYALNLIMGNVLHTGGTIVTQPAFNPESYLSAIERYKATCLHMAPPLILFLIQHPLVQQTDLSSVERIFSGGAPLGPEVEAEAVEKFRHLNIDIYQGYGLTETSPVTHACQRSNQRPQDGSVTGSIGISAPSQECKFVDPETRQELPPGQTGELAIRGPQVMKGYLGRPDATAECIDEEGWFYTGDIGHCDDRGYFFITDRVKELIKYKGFQVAPAEVESVLLSHPSIVDCAVVGRESVRYGELPTAFVVRKNKDLTDDDVHAFAGERLAPHKQLRGGVVFVDSVPRSQSGKLLRRLLRDQFKI